GVRDGPALLAHLQPARRARSDFRNRARRLYRPCARPRSRGGAGLLRFARGTGLSARKMKDTLLVELLTEELPPKSLRALSEAFAEKVRDSLVKAQLARGPDFAVFDTPRRPAFSLATALALSATPLRLAFSIPSVEASAAGRATEVTGPSAKAPATAIEG